MDDTEPEQVNRIHLPPIHLILKEGAAAAAAEKSLISTRTEEAVAYWLAQARRVAQLIEHGLAGKGKGNTLETNVKKIGISYRTAFIILRLDDEREMIEARIEADRERLGKRFKWPTRLKMLEWASDAKPKTKAVPRKVLEAEIESLRERNADLEARLNVAVQPVAPEPAPAPVAPEPEPISDRRARWMFSKRKEAAFAVKYHAEVAAWKAFEDALALDAAPQDVKLAMAAFHRAERATSGFIENEEVEARLFEAVGVNPLHPPANLAAINTAFRKASKALHQRHGSDTHPEYHEAKIEMNGAIAWLRDVYGVEVALPEREFADFEREPEYA